MAFSQQILLFFLSFFCTTILQVSSHSRHYTPPPVPRLTDMFNHVSVDQAFTKTFGLHNIKVLNNGSACTLALDKSSGSGLATKNVYTSGFFSTALKLPAGISSGVVVAFYLTNWDKFPHQHDEIDIEILGHDKRNDWVVQTNIYANGSVSTGREEKFYLWFDPTKEHHYYSILWNSHHIVFFIDNIPVREFLSTGAFSRAYPSKPMWLHVTMWDGSEWATTGGKYPVNYTNAPFVASFADFEVNGCVANPAAAADTTCSGAEPVRQGQDFSKLTSQQIGGLDWARRKLMFYSYCKDTRRYKNLLPECK